MAKGKEIIRGYGNANGPRQPVVCKIRVLDEDPDIPGNNPVTPKLVAIQKGECIVAVKTVPAQNDWLELAAAIIQNSSGKTSHGNDFALNKLDANGKHAPIPSIYNTQGVEQANGATAQHATEVLRDGQMVVVEGFIFEEEYKKTDGSMGRREYGAVYEHVPVTTPPLAVLMAKYGAKQR